MIVGSVTFCAWAGSLLGSFSKVSGSVPKANGTRLETMPLLLAAIQWMPGPASGGGSFNSASSRFQPFISTLAAVARPGAERKDARHERQLAGGDAIDEILAAAVDGVGDREHVLAVLGHFEEDHRIGLEAVIVVVGHFLSLGVVNGHHRLEPAGHGVGNEGDQLPRLGGEHQPLPLAGLETVAVHFAGSDLAVGRAGQRDALLDLVGGPLAQGLLLLAQHLERGAEHRLAGDLRQLTDVEDQRVRYAARRGQRQLARARRGVRRYGDLDQDEVGDRVAGRRVARIWPSRCSIRAASFARGLVLRRGRPFQLGELLPQQRHFLVVQSPQVLDHLGPHARAGDLHVMHSVQVLAAEPDLERRALLASGGIDETDIRPGLRLRRGRHRQHAGQRQDRDPVRAGTASQAESGSAQLVRTRAIDAVCTCLT